MYDTQPNKFARLQRWLWLRLWLPLWRFLKRVASAFFNAFDAIFTGDFSHRESPKYRKARLAFDIFAALTKAPIKLLVWLTDRWDWRYTSVLVLLAASAFLGRDWFGDEFDIDPSKAFPANIPDTLYLRVAYVLASIVLGLFFSWRRRLDARSAASFFQADPTSPSSTIARGHRIALERIGVLAIASGVGVTLWGIQSRPEDSAQVWWPIAGTWAIVAFMLMFTYLFETWQYNMALIRSWDHEPRRRRSIQRPDLFSFATRHYWNMAGFAFGVALFNFVNFVLYPKTDSGLTIEQLVQRVYLPIYLACIIAFVVWPFFSQKRRLTNGKREVLREIEAEEHKLLDDRSVQGAADLQSARKLVNDLYPTQPLQTRLAAQIATLAGLISPAISAIRFLQQSGNS
jgi:hypothetical protein